MKSFLKILVASILLIGCGKNENSEKSTRDSLAVLETQLSRPLVTHIYTADPAAHVFNGRIYIYPSHDIQTGTPDNENGDHFDMRDYHVLSMDSIGGKVTDHGIALDIKDIPWAGRQLWAPDAAFANSMYYLFFPVKDKEDVFRIGVATSAKPEGPFIAEAAPIAGSYSIDPTVFKDDDGSYYLYFGGIWGGQLQHWDNNEYHSNGALRKPEEAAILPRVAKLSADLKSFAENVQEEAITMGVGTILKSKRVIMMAWGEGKAAVVKKAIEGPITDQIPSTFLQKHPNALAVLDDAAASQLTVVNTPWLVETLAWNEKLIRKAVVWLCQKLQKPILKLTNHDYLEHGMGDILTEFGSAYQINIKVFNQLQHTITGWPGGKPNADDSNRPERATPFPKRVIIFSPHPDDDVISMGGTFIRLVDQKHEVHVAYQTSGNIAVFDDDAIRFADFVRDFDLQFGLNKEEGQIFYNKIVNDIKGKKPGDIDSPEVMKIKGLIRRGEAKAGCRYTGIPDSQAHFLDMPFYETGAVKKKPLGEADIQIIVDLIEKIKPHQIYAAGDLSDPHGTHRVCLSAIFQAIEKLKKNK